MSLNRERTIEDHVDEQDAEYRRAMNSAVGWAVRNMGEDVPEDIHDRRFQSVMEGERRDISHREGRR